MKTLIRKAHSCRLRLLNGQELLAEKRERVPLPDHVADQLLRDEPDNWEEHGYDMPIAPPSTTALDEDVFDDGQEEE